MSIRYRCEACGATMKIRDSLAGTSGRCPLCKNKFVVPTESVLSEEEFAAAQLEQKQKEKQQESRSGSVEKTAPKKSVPTSPSSSASVPTSKPSASDSQSAASPSSAAPPPRQEKPVPTRARPEPVDEMQALFAAAESELDEEEEQPRRRTPARPPQPPAARSVEAEEPVDEMQALFAAAEAELDGDQPPRRSRSATPKEKPETQTSKKPETQALPDDSGSEIESEGQPESVTTPAPVKKSPTSNRTPPPAKSSPVEADPFEDAVNDVLETAEEEAEPSAVENSEPDEFDADAFMTDGHDAEELQRRIEEEQAAANRPSVDAMGRRYIGGAPKKPTELPTDDDSGGSVATKAKLPQTEEKPKTDWTALRRELIRRWPWILGICAAVVVVSFIGNWLFASKLPVPPLHRVAGKVTLDGTPLAGVSVQLTPINSKSGMSRNGVKIRLNDSVGVTDAEGNFVMSYNGQLGAPPGQMRIWIAPLKIADYRRIPQRYLIPGSDIREVREAGNDGKFDLAIKGLAATPVATPQPVAPANGAPSH